MCSSVHHLGTSTALLSSPNRKGTLWNRLVLWSRLPLYPFLTVTLHCRLRVPSSCTMGGEHRGGISRCLVAPNRRERSRSTRAIRSDVHWWWITARSPSLLIPLLRPFRPELHPPPPNRVMSSPGLFECFGRLWLQPVQCIAWQLGGSMHSNVTLEPPVSSDPLHLIALHDGSSKYPPRVTLDTRPPTIVKIVHVDVQQCATMEVGSPEIR